VAPVLSRKGGAAATINPVLLVGGGLAVLLGLLLGTYVLIGAEDSDIKVAAEAEQSVAITDTSSVALAIVDDEVEVVGEAPVSRPVATMRLGLQFNEESWVEISDANRRLLFGLQREGYRREVTGEPPFNLLIGNASGVTMTIDDEPFDMPVSRIRGKVARFEISGAKPE
jgi:cytoskeleton protein RodZ